MESALSSTMWMLILAALFYTTDGDLLFCDPGNMAERERSSTKLWTDEYSFNQYKSDIDKCLCIVKANGTVYLKSTVEFMTDPDAQGANDTCGPLLKFEYEKMGSFVCPTKGQVVKNDTVLTHHLNHEEEISVEIINSGNTRLQAMISFDAEVFQGTFSLECQTVRASSSRGVCPCNPFVMMGMGDTGFTASEDVSLGTRFAIAVVCVIIFLLIFGGLFLLWWKKLRHRDSDDYKDGPDGMPQQPVPVAPAGLTHVEKGHVNPQFTDIGQRNVDGDPELNLALQTPSNSMGSKGPRGSTDSGLYSQGNGQYYANVPGDHADGLPPDMLYTPGLNLSGHADLQGPGAPRTNRPVDVDALYAKPNKGGNRSKSGSRSGSQDQLHVPPQGYHPQGHHSYGPGYHQQPGVQHPEWAVNESYVSDSSHNASQGSLNTSHPTVETDV